jgi:phage N-6-adenine-methyltransferase
MMKNQDVSGIDPVAPGPAQAEADTTLRCPKCGRPVSSLLCGHCGSRLSPEQADLYGAVVKKILETGGDRTDATNKGGIPDEAEPHTVTGEQSQNKNDPPKDNGGYATPRWLFSHCNRLAIAACGEPITLDVAAAAWNAKCERYFTEEDDGLTKPWDVKASWCNPPYSATIIESFVRKAIDAARHGTTTICLLPWWSYPFMDLCERHGRIHRVCNPVSFRRQDGSPLTLNNGFHTTSLVVVVFGPTVRAGFGTPIRRDGDRAASPAGDGSSADGEGIGQDRKGRQEDPDGQEYDETIANDLRQVECPYCGKSFPI